MKRSILITGASSGIGYGCAKYFIDRGYQVFGSVRNASDAQRCQSDLGDAFTPLIFDVRDRAAIDDAAKVVVDRLNGQNLTALINNAGIAVSGPIQFVKEQDLQNQYDINVIGLIKSTQAFLPLLGGTLENTSPAGRIINISSVAGTLTTPMQVAYCSSKHAVESITDGLRREMVVYGIKVISIRPGPIQSPIWQKAKADNLDLTGTRYETIWKYKDRRLEQAEASALPVEYVAKAVEKAIISKNPKMRYLVYGKPMLYRLVRLLPDRLVDRLFTKQLKKVNRGEEVAALK